MNITRINCFEATCEKCNNHVLVKINGWGDFIYKCSFVKENHDGSEAEYCKDFRCSDRGISVECCNCTGGEDLETYVKKHM